MQWVAFASLGDVRAAWQELAERASEPNIFYEPTFAFAAADAFGRDAGAILVWSRHDRSRLIGFFPVRNAVRRFGLASSTLRGWTHPYAPLGVPLVDREEAADAIAAWLDFIAGDPNLPRLALLSYVPTRGPFAEALQAALAQRGGRCRSFGRHARALLAPQEGRADYLQTAVSARKRKELTRQRRRLNEHGFLAFDTATTPDDILHALDAFMRLEQGGWKGAAGTAAASNLAVRRFMQRALAGLAARAQARIVTMRSGERAVAVGILLRSGANAWFWKVAYDETVARASPGVQLALELTRTLAADASLAHIDSCATQDHPMIDHLWRERIELADLLIAPDARANRAFALAVPLERARRRIIDAAKWARIRLGRR